MKKTPVPVPVATAAPSPAPKEKSATGSFGVKSSDLKDFNKNAKNSSDFSKETEKEPTKGSTPTTTTTTNGSIFDGLKNWKQSTGAHYLQKGMDGAKYGLIGMIFGTLYGFVKGTANDQGLGIDLDPKPEAFDMDYSAPKLFYNLSKYRHLHEEAYCAALRYADALFLRERSIFNEKKSNAADQSVIDSFADCAVGSIMLMRERATDAETRNNINILKDNISSMLQDHRKRVYYLLTPYKE
jgi:hypothetical protein